MLSFIFPFIFHSLNNLVTARFRNLLTPSLSKGHISPTSCQIQEIQGFLFRTSTNDKWWRFSRLDSGTVRECSHSSMWISPIYVFKKETIELLLALKCGLKQLIQISTTDKMVNCLKLCAKCNKYSIKPKYIAWRTQRRPGPEDFWMRSAVQGVQSKEKRIS